MLTSTQLEYWQGIKEEMFNNKSFMDYNQQRDNLRISAKQEILLLLNSFAKNEIITEEFRSSFDSKQKLSGMSLA